MWTICLHVYIKSVETQGAASGSTLLHKAPPQRRDIRVVGIAWHRAVRCRFRADGLRLTPPIQFCRGAGI